MENKLPTNWHDVKLGQWIELQEIQNDPDIINRDFEILALFQDITLEDEYFDNDMSVINKDLRSLWFLRVPPKPIVTEWEKWRPIPPNSITLGQFIDIEHYISDTITNYPIILAILMRQWRQNEWSETLFEPYQYQPTERADQFLSIPVPIASGILEQYISWRTDFMDKYSLLFHSEEENIDEEGVELTGREILDAKVAAKRQQIAIKWSWERLLWDLTGGDITKMESLLETPVILVFNILSMRKAIGD